MFRNYTKRFLNLELNMTFDNKCVILMSPLTMATMTPMANLDTKSWLSSMVVTIFVKHPSNAYLNKQAVASRYSAFCFNLTYGLIRSLVESELFDTPVSFSPKICWQDLLIFSMKTCLLASSVSTQEPFSNIHSQHPSGTWLLGKR